MIDRGADLSSRDNYGGTPLHEACLNGRTDIALALIDLGADVSAKDNYGDTPLHFACNKGHEETALALIARGADIFSKDRLGRTFADVSPDILPRVYERLHVSTVRSYLVHQ